MRYKLFLAADARAKLLEWNSWPRGSQPPTAHGKILNPEMIQK